MARIAPIDISTAPASIQVAFQRDSATADPQFRNTKATMGYSLLALNVYTQWYQLFEELAAFLGERKAALLGYAISAANRCEVFTAYFAKRLYVPVEETAPLWIDESEKNIVALGEAIVRHRGIIPDEVYNKVAAVYNSREMVVLVSFAGQMIATNIFNNVIQIDPDQYLEEYLLSRQFNQAL